MFCLYAFPYNKLYFAKIRISEQNNIKFTWIFYSEREYFRRLRQVIEKIDIKNGKQN